MSESRGIVLVDQDGPLADWESALLRRWRELFPKLPSIGIFDRLRFPEKHDAGIGQRGAADSHLGPLS